MTTLPTFTLANNSVWCRILIIPFNTKFVQKPKQKNEKRINGKLVDGIKNNNSFYNKFINLLFKYYTGETMRKIKMPNTFNYVKDDKIKMKDGLSKFLSTNLKYTLDSVKSTWEIISAYFKNDISPDKKFFVYKIYFKKINDHIQDLNANENIIKEVELILVTKM